MTTQEHDLVFPSCLVPEEIENDASLSLAQQKLSGSLRIPGPVAERWPRGGGAGCGGEVAGLAVAPLEDDEQQGEHSVLITAAKPTRA